MEIFKKSSNTYSKICKSLKNPFICHKNLLYYNMKKAYEKAIKVIESCKNSSQITCAYNYIWNFRALFTDIKGCKELTKKLHDRCFRKRKSLGNGDSK